MLEEKGIISSGSKSIKPNSQKTPTLGSLFKNIIEELTRDPEQRKEPPAASFSWDDDDSHESFTAADTETEVVKSDHNSRRLKEEETHRQMKENNLREARNIAEKKREERAREVWQKKEETILEQEKHALEEKSASITNYSALLREKSSLRQAFVLTEILSKPVGLR